MDVKHLTEYSTLIRHHILDFMLQKIKNKYSVFSALVILSLGVYFLVWYMHHTASPSAILTAQKCPDDYANTDAGEAEYLAATNKWTNEFYDVHLGATLSDWSAARYQFWVENHCTAALERYSEIKAGRGDQAVMERVRSGVQEAIDDNAQVKKSN